MKITMTFFDLLLTFATISKADYYDTQEVETAPLFKNHYMTCTSIDKFSYPSRLDFYLDNTRTQIQFKQFQSDMYGKWTFDHMGDPLAVKFELQSIHIMRDKKLMFLANFDPKNTNAYIVSGFGGYGRTTFPYSCRLIGKF